MFLSGEVVLFELVRDDGWAWGLDWVGTVEAFAIPPFRKNARKDGAPIFRGNRCKLQVLRLRALRFALDDNASGSFAAKLFTSGKSSLLQIQSLLHQVQGAAPARLVEEVDDDMEDKAHAVANGGLVDLVFRGNKRPVNDKRAAHDVFAWHKTPVTAVEAHRAIVAHGEIMARRDDQIV